MTEGWVEWDLDANQPMHEPGRPGTVNLGPCHELPSIVFKVWVNLGICWTAWTTPRGHGEVPHVCMSARAVPHQCVCIHEPCQPRLT